MHELRTGIGEHCVLIRTPSLQVSQWIMRYFRVLGDCERNVDLVVRVEEGFGVQFCSYDVDVLETVEGVSYTRADYRIEVDSEHRLANVYVFDDFALKHALMNLYSAYIVHHRWGLLIHSSCVLREGRAYLFAGRSGAGKSTVARLSRPRAVLSDEATIVKISDGGVVVFDSPFRSDSIPEHLEGGFPLSAIHLLNQSGQIKRTKLPRSHGVLQLADKVFYWSYNPKETMKVFRMYQKLAEQVQVYDLFFQKNDAFWGEIS